MTYILELKTTQKQLQQPNKQHHTLTEPQKIRDHGNIAEITESLSKTEFSVGKTQKTCFLVKIVLFSFYLYKNIFGQNRTFNL